jgi:hypothetical protein
MSAQLPAGAKLESLKHPGKLFVCLFVFVSANFAVAVFTVQTRALSILSMTLSGGTQQQRHAHTKKKKRDRYPLQKGHRPALTERQIDRLSAMEIRADCIGWRGGHRGQHSAPASKSSWISSSDQHHQTGCTAHAVHPASIAPSMVTIDVQVRQCIRRVRLFSCSTPPYYETCFVEKVLLALPEGSIPSCRNSAATGTSLAEHTSRSIAPGSGHTNGRWLVCWSRIIAESHRRPVCLRLVRSLCILLKATLFTEQQPAPGFLAVILCLESYPAICVNPSAFTDVLWKVRALPAT